MSAQSYSNAGRSSIKQESRTYFRKLGTRIAEVRKAQGMTQAELARALGVSQQSVFAYELGDRRVSLFMLGKLAAVFEISLEQLLGSAPPRPASRRLSAQWVHHARRMQGLSRTARRFVVKIIDVLEQGQRNRPQ